MENPLTLAQKLDLSPAYFAWRHLGLDLYGWQIDALEKISCRGQGVMHGGPPTTLCAANGSGKTQHVIAASILWFMNTFPRGRCPVTSGSWMQVEKQLFPALHAFRGHPLFRGWQFNQTEIRTPQGGQVIGFSTDNAGRAEGWHPGAGQDEDPVFYVVDEAKTVPDGIFEAIGRCTLRFHLLASSPGAPRGKFFRSHHQEAGMHRTVKATSFDCPHISPEKIERDRRLYGDDHPLFRSMHLAEFTEDSERLVISADRLTKALEAQPAATVAAGETVAFCDFAAGGDENVLAVRKGNHARIVAAWREKDTIQAVRQFVKHFNDEKLAPGHIWGDADGLGTVMIDALAEAGWRINRFHGGQAASDKEEYANLIAEVWHVGAGEIERGRIHLGQLDPVTFEQLTTRKSEWTDTGKLRVESKDKMRANGIKSPDRADALLGAIACGSRITGAVSARDLLPAEASDFGGLVTGF
jgi:phage terminase large subunit